MLGGKKEKKKSPPSAKALVSLDMFYTFFGSIEHNYARNKEVCKYGDKTHIEEASNFCTCN